MTTRKTVHHAAMGFAIVALSAMSCGGAGVAPSQEVSCSGETRRSIDCSSEVSYQGYRANGGFGIKNLAQADIKAEQTALRRIDEHTERFIAEQTRLCREYNACVLDKEAYSAETKEIRNRLTRVPLLVEAIKNATTETERLTAIDKLYRDTVPQEKRVEEVTLLLSMDADIPDLGSSVGGKRVTMYSGMALPTGAKVAFNVHVSPQAYVYIFQKDPRGELTVLFPDERIGTTNPLQGSSRIPHGEMRFKLNEKDIGLEAVYIAASRAPVQNLDAALSKVNAKMISSINDDAVLKSFATLPDPIEEAKPEKRQAKCRAFELDMGAAASGGGCRRSRGLELEGDDEPPARGAAVREGGGVDVATAAVAARTEPGDGLIVKVFSFMHMTEKEYIAKGQHLKGKSRSTVILE